MRVQSALLASSIRPAGVHTLLSLSETIPWSRLEALLVYYHFVYTFIPTYLPYGLLNILQN